MGTIEEDAAYVVLSPHRTKVFLRLANGSAIPAQIRDDTGQEYSRISEALNDLTDRDLVKLLVSEDTKRGRLYGVSEHGEDVIQYMRVNNMI